MRCPKCDAGLPDGAAFCFRCGTGTDGSGPVAEAAPGDPGLVERLIPSKNVKAVVAYYLAVFSVIPCVGAPLGLAALVLGILGLRYAKEHPEARGRVHAWVGVLLGGLCGIGYTVLVIAVLATLEP